MAFENFFTTYDMVEPPAGYKDNPNLKIPDIEETNFTQYPMVTTIDNPTMVTDLEDFPGVISPFDIQVGEPFKRTEITRTGNKANDVVNLARTFLDKPYVWGSMDPNKGFDCSGLINYVYQQIGIQLPRTSHAMAKVGTEVQLSDVQPGDIIYTSSKGPSGGHVKMVSSVANGQISVIEAKGKKWGIVESILTNTSNIKSIRRVLDPEFATSVPEANTTSTGKFDDRKEFISALNNTYREVLTEHGLDPDYSYILTSSAAIESGWGTKVSGKFNYGGVQGRTGTIKSTIDYVNGQYIRRNQTFRDFSSIKDYCNYVVNLLSNNRYNAFNTFSASRPFQFWRHVLDAGYGGGDTAGKNSYMNSVSKIYSMIKRTLA